jgi:hypothetical protein
MLVSRSETVFIENNNTFLREVEGTMRIKLGECNRPIRFSMKILKEIEKRSTVAEIETEYGP